MMLTVTGDKKVNKNHFNNTLFVDIAVWGVFVSIGFLFFTYSDIIVTAERSFLLLEGHITDLYSASQTYTGGGANYFPTTFILFAIWNIPLKLMGFSPDGLFSSGAVQILWYKLLPTLCYIFSALLVYKIANKRLSYTPQKSRLIMYCYAASPVGFFSQFFFYQYDIFTVVFILLGLWYYFSPDFKKKDKLWFCLFFSLAITCKYFAALIFVVMVFLREKRISKILQFAAGGVSVIGIQLLICILLDRDAFVAQVLKFGALDYVNSFQITIGNSPISIFLIFTCVLIAWSYFIKPKDFNNLIDYALYFCCGICFGLFGLMTWHPQWLLLGTFFWSLSSFRNKNYKIWMLLDTVFGVLFVYYVVNRWSYMVDQHMFSYGILGEQFRGKFMQGALRMGDIFRSNSTIMTYLFSAIIAILLVNFIFKHPKYSMANHADQLCVYPLRIRFLTGVLVFLIPAFICLFSVMAQPDILWKSAETGVGTSTKTTIADINLQCGDSLIQPVELDGMSLEKVSVLAGQCSIADPSTGMKLSLIQNGAVIAEATVSGAEKIRDQKFVIFDFKRQPIEKGAYSLKLQRLDENVNDLIVLVSCNARSSLALQQGYAESSQPRQLVMAAGGR